MKDNKISTELLPIPHSDDDVFKILDPFILALTEAVAATAKFDGIVTVYEYKALSEVASNLDQFTLHPGLMSTLILRSITKDVSYETAMKNLKASAKNVSIEARKSAFEAINPIVNAQVERINDLFEDWAGALKVENVNAKKDYIDSIYDSLNRFINKLPTFNYGQNSDLNKVKKVAKIFSDERLSSAITKLDSDKEIISDSYLKKEIQDSIDRAMTYTSNELKSEDFLKQQIEISERFLKTAEALSEHVILRLQSIKNRLELQGEMFKEDLDEFVKHASDSVELGMRDIMEGRQNWADKTIWDQFRSRGAYLEIVDNFDPLKRRYERLFEQWYQEIESFTKEVGVMRSGVLKNVDPQVFASLVPTDHRMAEIKGAIDRAADTTIVLTVLGGLGTAGAMIFGVVQAGAIASLLLTPVGAVAGTALGLASIWKIISDTDARKREFIQDKRQIIESKLKEILSEEVFNHDDIAQDIMNKFLEASSQQYAPLIIDARMAAFRAKLERKVVELILNNTKEVLALIK